MLHACWNAIAKAVEDRVVIFAWIGVFLLAIGAIGLLFTGFPVRQAVPYAVASSVIHIAYDLALMNAYRRGPFNQMYPVARGTAPLLVALGAAIFVGEDPSGFALAGIIVLCGGLMSLALSSGRLVRGEMPALGAALLTGLTIACYTLVDGLGVRESHHPFSYMALLFLLQGPVFLVIAARQRSTAIWRSGRIAALGLIAGVLTAVAYGAVLWAQARAPLAQVAALRETGVVSAAIVGALFFKEGFGYRRLIAAVLVAGGIVLISL